MRDRGQHLREQAGILEEVKVEPEVPVARAPTAEAEVPEATATVEEEARQADSEASTSP